MSENPMPSDNSDELLAQLAPDLRTRIKDLLKLRNLSFHDWLTEQTERQVEADDWMGLALNEGQTVAWRWEYETDRIDLSENASEVLGLKPGGTSISKAEMLALLHHEDLPRVRSDLALEKNKERSTTIQFRILRPDNGEIAWIELRARNIKGPLGPRLMGAANNITARKKAEETLREREEHLRAIIDNTPECIKVVEPGGTVLQMNPAGLEMVEAPSESTIRGVSVLKLIAPEYHDRFLAFHEMVCGGNKGVLEFEIVGDRGARRYMESHAAPLKRPDGSTVQLAITRDITARRSAENAVRRERDLLRVILACIGDAVVTTDTSGIITHMNGGAERLTGWNSDAASGQPLDAVLRLIDEHSGEEITCLPPREDLANFPGALIHAILRTKEGGETLVECKSAPIHGGPDEDSGGSVWVLTDISERKKAELTLREHADQFRHIANNAPAMLWLTDPDGRCTFLSQGWLDFTGQSESEGLGFGWLKAVHPDDFERSGRIFREANSSQNPFSIDYRVRRYDGEYRWAIDSGRPRFDDKGNFLGFIGSVIDVDQRKRAEEFRTGQAYLLELVASEEPLDGILDELVRFVERQIPQAIASVLLSDPKGELLRHWAGPSLPKEYTDAIDRIPIAPSAGSCGTAAYRREPVVVEDIASDPLWGDFGDVALSHSLRSCWSHPILATDGTLLGTFAIYFREVRKPTPSQIRILTEMARFSGMIIERPRAQQALRESEQRLRAFIDATSDTAYRISADWSELRQLQGSNFIMEPAEPSRLWIETYVHPEDRERVLEAIEKAVTGKCAFEMEHRVMKEDGNVGWALSRSIPLLNHEGEIVEWFGAASDITARKEAAETQKRTAETFANLIEKSPFGIYVVDSDFRVAQISAGAEPAFRNVQPVIGRDFGEVMHRLWPESFANEAINIFRHTLETGEPYTSPGLTEMRRDVGSIESYEWEVIRVTLADGQYGVVCYYFDSTRLQTALVALKESEERFRMLAENMSQLAWTCDELGAVTWYNQRWFDYTGSTFAEMREWGWKKVHHPDHVDQVVEKIETARDSGTTWEDTFPIRGKDGTYRWFLSRAVPIRDSDGKIVRWFGTNTDVTELRETQQLLHDADRRKDEFLATLAHELRNPLAPIRTGLEVMKMASDNPEIQEKVRNTIERQTQQLVSLVDDLMNVSRITRGKMELRKSKVALIEIFQSSIEASQSHIEEAGHDLLVSQPEHTIFLEADRNRMIQIFSNLLINAAKYTPPGGRIRFSSEVQDSQVTVSVEDNGIGIPENMSDRIFEMFAQIDRPQEKGYSGLGIGLCLVKSLVEMHGGSISVSSDGHRKGSVFRVSLPIQRGALTQTDLIASQKGPRKRGTSQKVLIVDDNVEAASMLSMEIEMFGHRVEVAHDGREAVDLAAEFRPDIIFMDLGMPHMNGYEAARAIRKKAWGQETMLVALTGWGQESDRQKSKEAGFDRHLVKPVAAEELEKALSFTKLPPID
ncbi:PAS domain S-box protein [Haloferula chungangensis]|uniref:histidine kinase n=1 Tax=Haloferula chungangensis TaxID=1048331 RepID=A0ABW2L8L1_9BACT